MHLLSMLILIVSIALFVPTATQDDSDRLVTNGNNIRNAHDNILDIQIAVTNVGRIKYQDGDVIIFQNQLSSSDFFFTPFPYIESNLTECNYNDFNGQNELTLVVSLYTTNLVELVEKYIKNKYQDICNIKQCEVALLPMHSIRLFQKGPRTTESLSKYTLDSEWHSNTQLRQMIDFLIYTSNMSVCENLKKSIILRCLLSNFEVQYSLQSQKTVARTLEVTTEHITNTSMYNKIKSQLDSNDQNTIGLTGNDYKNLISETMDKITMNIRVEEGYESIQGSVDIDRLLDRQLQYKQVQLTKIDDTLWNSLYWTPELTRPDRLSKVLNKILKQDVTDVEKFRFDYSQADESLKQNLKLHDKRKLDNLEKDLAANSHGHREREVSLNNDALHYVIETSQYNDTNSKRKNNTKIILERKEAEKLVQYLSENVEIEGDIIKPKPIDVTLIKLGSLKSKTKLFSNTIYVKTRMNVHVLPLRCPYKYRHHSSTIWLEQSHYRLSSIVDNMTKIIDYNYGRLLTVVTNLSNMINSKYKGSEDMMKAKFNQTSKMIENLTAFVNGSQAKLRAVLNKTIDDLTIAQIRQVKALVNAIELNVIKRIDQKEGVMNFTMNETAKYFHDKIMEQLSINENTTNSGLIEKINDLDKKVTNNTHALQTLITYENSSINTPYLFGDQNPIASISVVHHSPLKVKVQLIDGRWFQGMVCDDEFNQDAAMVACRSSISSASAASFTSVSWTPDSSCESGVELYGVLSKKHQCNFILDDVSCLSNSYSSLKDCNITSIFRHNCGASEYVNLYCA